MGYYDDETPRSNDDIFDALRDLRRDVIQLEEQLDRIETNTHLANEVVNHLKRDMNGLKRDMNNNRSTGWGSIISILLLLFIAWPRLVAFF